MDINTLQEKHPDIVDHFKSLGAQEAKEASIEGNKTHGSEGKCKQIWEENPLRNGLSLQDEFGGNFDTYFAYEKATAEGKAKICAPGLVH